MEPHVVLNADVCDFMDGVEGSVDRGSSGGVYKHGNITLETRSREKAERSTTSCGSVGDSAVF